MLYSGSAQERSYTAGGLKAYEEYSFTVTVCNRQGCVSSPPVSGRTLSSGQYHPYNLHSVYLASSLWCYVFKLLNQSFSFMSFTDWFKILFQQCYIIPDTNYKNQSQLFYFKKFTVYNGVHTVCGHSTSNYVWALWYMLSLKGEKPE